MGDLLRVDGLSVEFRTPTGTVRAVDDLSFRVRPGSAVALVGESGSGKSVSVQSLMGLLPGNGRIAAGSAVFDRGPEEGGPIDLAGLDRNDRRFRRLRGGRMAMIFQEPMTSLSPLHTIGDQIGEAARCHTAVDRRQARDMTIEMLGRVGFPDPAHAVDSYPFQLSGGLRQRAMIAMALICRPTLLIADEPTTALDVTIQAQILALIDRLRRELQMAVLLITHDLGIVAAMAEEVVVMYRGRLMESGAVDDIFERPAHPYVRALMRAVPRLGMPAGERLQPLRPIPSVAGGHFGNAPPPPTNARPLLEAKNLSKSFRDRRTTGLFGRRVRRSVLAVDDVSFTIANGSCFGLVGESGCGKTTVSRMIVGAVSADAGRILYAANGDDAVDLATLDDRERFPMRARIQYVFQDPFSSLDPRQTVLDCLMEPLAIHGIGDAADRRETAVELMRIVGLDPRWLSRYPHSFSGGQRQRIVIARALALKPTLLICDEPVSALDVSVQAQILNLLKDLKAHLGLTCLFISHNLAVVDYMSDRIAVMCAGRIVEEASRETLFRRPIHPYTRALIRAIPEPVLSRRLDLGRFTADGATDPKAWPAPFTLDDGIPSHWLEVGSGHFVRAAEPPAAGAMP